MLIHTHSSIQVREGKRMNAIKREIGNNIEAHIDALKFKNNLHIERLKTKEYLNSVYLRLRASDQRLTDQIKSLQGNLKYNAENAYNTSTTSKQWSKDFSLILLAEFLMSVADIPISDDEEEEQIWLKQIEIVNSLGDADLNRLFVDAEECAKHSLYLYDIVRELADCLLRQRANKEVLNIVAQELARAMNKYAEIVFDDDDDDDDGVLVETINEDGTHKSILRIE